MPKSAHSADKSTRRAWRPRPPSDQDRAAFAAFKATLERWRFAINAARGLRGKHHRRVLMALLEGAALSNSRQHFKETGDLETFVGGARLGLLLDVSRGRVGEMRAELCRDDGPLEPVRVKGGRGRAGRYRFRPSWLDAAEAEMRARGIKLPVRKVTTFRPETDDITVVTSSSSISAAPKEGTAADIEGETAPSGAALRLDGSAPPGAYGPHPPRASGSQGQKAKKAKKGRRGKQARPLSRAEQAQRTAAKKREQQLRMLNERIRKQDEAARERRKRWTALAQQLVDGALCQRPATADEVECVVRWMQKDGCTEADAKAALNGYVHEAMADDAEWTGADQDFCLQHLEYHVHAMRDLAKPSAA